MSIHAFSTAANVEIIHSCHAFVQQVALHLVATGTFKDVYGITRKNGEEWLITKAEGEAHIPDVYEEVFLFYTYYHLFNYIYAEISAEF